MSFKTRKLTEEPKLLHPMVSFGSVTGLTENIRINLLSARLDPLVPFPHKHDFYQILLVTKGQGCHEIDFERYKVQRGSVFIMQPAQVHTWTLNAQTDGFVIEFHASTFSFKDPYWRVFKQKLQTLPKAPHICAKNFQKLIESVTYSYEEYLTKQNDYSFVLMSELLQFLIHLERSLDKPLIIEEGSSELLDEFTRLLEESFRKEHRVSFYASELNVSAKALTMRFQRLGLKAPREFIQDRCLLESKRLLIYSKFTIQDIAERLGFEDPNYFARFFKKHSGVNPGQFRNRP